jgi:hypothetical protein
VDIKNQLLAWIGEDTQRLSSENRKPVIAIHLLLVRMALMNRGQDASLTASTELSLQIFDRSTVYRFLREMYSEGLLLFANQAGDEVPVDDKELTLAASGGKTEAKFVILTELGSEEARKAAAGQESAGS